MLSFSPCDVFDKHTAGVKAIAVTPDGKRLISHAFDEAFLQVTDLQSGELLQSIPPPVGPREYVIRSILCVPPDGTIVVLLSSSMVHVFDTSTSEFLLQHGGFAPYFKAAFSPSDPKYLALAGTGGMAVYDWKASLQYNFEADAGISVMAVTFSPDGQEIVTGTSDSKVVVWDWKTGQQDNSQPVKPVHIFKGHKAPVLAVHFTSDKRYLISGAEDTIIKVWDYKSKKLVKTFSVFSGMIDGMLLTKDNRHLILGSFDKKLKVWSLSGKQNQDFVAHNDWVSSVCSTPDGSKILSGSADKLIKMWHWRGVKPLLLRCLEEVRRNNDYFAERLHILPVEVAEMLEWGASRDQRFISQRAREEKKKRKAERRRKINHLSL